MGTYSNRNHVIPENATGSSFLHFTWLYPGTFYSPSEASLTHPQGTQVNPQPVFPAAPIQSVAPTPESIKTMNPKRPRPSVKASSQIPPKNTMKSKQPRKTPPKMKGQSMPEGKREKRNFSVDIDTINFDISRVPSPFCSCTGMPRVCYKWGAGGWQSSCCTISVSQYPLPMNPTRPGARLAGRKMSNGAYMKLLLKLAAEGYDLSHPVNLKHHWARHGTNKFVTIK